MDKLQTDGEEKRKPLKKVENPNAAVKLIEKMDKMIKIDKKNILMIAYKPTFISAVSTFKISKARINFKITIAEFIDKYPRMEKSCISLYCLKNNFKIIKEVCQENASEFQ